MELGHWLMIIGGMLIIGGFLYMLSDESYDLRRTPISVLIIILGTLMLTLGAVIQDSVNTEEGHKQCLQSGGEWLGKLEYSLATKTYVTRYNCYTIKEVTNE